MPSGALGTEFTVCVLVDGRLWGLWRVWQCNLETKGVRSQGACMPPTRGEWRSARDSETRDSRAAPAAVAFPEDSFRRNVPEALAGDHVVARLEHHAAPLTAAGEVV